MYTRKEREKFIEDMMRQQESLAARERVKEIMKGVCKKCGERYRLDYKFCPYCGAKRKNDE